MNTLRKLKENWQRPFDGSPEDEYERGYLDASVEIADELSAEIPKWERLADMLEELIKGATDSDHVVLVHVPSVRTALSKVRHD